MRKFVLFDFDGVIADSFSAAFTTARTYCAQKTEASYRAQFEGNIYDYKHDLLTGDHSACSHDIDWWGTFVPLFEETAKPFAGISEALHRLSHAYTLIIVSSSVTSPINGFLEKHDLGRYIAEVLAIEAHTHKTEKISMIFSKYGTSAEKCVFVTDTLGDMKEATAVGVGSIGCTWGFQDRQTLERGEPFRIIDAPSLLPEAVDEYFSTMRARS